MASGHFIIYPFETSEADEHRRRRFLTTQPFPVCMVCSAPDDGEVLCPEGAGGRALYTLNLACASTTIATTAGDSADSADSTDSTDSTDTPDALRIWRTSPTRPAAWESADTSEAARQTETADSLSVDC